MNGHAKRRDEKTRQIVRAALDLFERYGFRKVSVSEIAEKAGVSQVTIYKYFKTKHQLVRHCIRQYLIQSAEEYAELLRTDRPFLERLRIVMTDKVATLDRFQGELVTELESEDPEYVGQIVSERRRILRTASAPFFEEGRALGLVRGDLSNAMILAYLDVVGTGAMHSTLFRAVEAEEEDAFAKLQELAVRAILKCPVPDQT